MKLLLTIFVASVVGTCLGLPRAQRSAVMAPPRAACVSSQIIAVNLLKDAVEKEGNNVFSPLGISSILAILAEGARGTTYDEFKAALNYPEDRQQLRESFKEVLESLYQKNLSKAPSFRTWFYVYKNNSARDEYKKILHDYYLVDVKEVEMNKPLARADPSSPSAMTSTTPANNSKDISGFEALKKSQPLEETPSVPEEKKDASKFDQVVEDKQYVEVPVIKEEMAKEEMAKEEMTKEEMPKEEMTKEEMANEEMAKEEMTKEEMTKEDLPKEEKEMEEMVKDEMAKENEAKEEVTIELRIKEDKMPKEEMMKEDIPKEDMVKEEMPMENMPVEKMPMKEIPKEEMAQKDMPEQMILQIKPEEMMPMAEEMKKDKMPESDKILDEKPILMKAEKAAEPALEKAQNSADLNMEDNETVKDEEKIEVLRKNSETAPPAEEKQSNEPEKISIPLKKLEDLEIMQALESHFVAKRFSEPRSLFMPDDVASALSANSIIGEEKPSITKMLLFNGLYYRGNWRYPFQELRSSKDDVFYVTPEKSIPVTMMRSRGTFRMATLEDISSLAIELPYEDDRYVLYIIVPNRHDGLKNAIQNLTPDIFEKISANLFSAPMNLWLPKFCAEQTNRAESVLQRLGLKSIFTKSADLSALSDMKDLFVEGVVQHVNVKVDEGATRENALTAVAQSRAADEEPEEQKIVVDRPFLYFILDKQTNVVIVAGKVTEPKTQSSFDMEM